jgi:Tfp pilus assembly protein PilZ
VSATVAASNTRSYHRTPVAFQSMTVVAQTGGRVVGTQGWITDLSGSGARLTVSLPVQVGDVVHLRLTLPDHSDSDTVRGRVVWAEPMRGGHQHQIGVAFTDLSDRLRDRIVHTVFRAELALRQVAA